MFWGRAAKNVPWYRPFDRVLNRDNPPFFRWFEGGSVNSCHAALDVHCENGRGDNVALIYDSPVTDTRRKYTYRELRDLVARCAGGLRGLGVAKGDRVVIYMPMIPEAAYAIFEQCDRPEFGLKRLRITDFQALAGFEWTLGPILKRMLAFSRERRFHMLENSGCWLSRSGLPAACRRE